MRSDAMAPMFIQQILTLLLPVNLSSATSPTSTTSLETQKPRTHPNNARLYSLKQILENNFVNPQDYDHDEKDLIWSIGSRYHADFGKPTGSVGGSSDRVAQYSLGITFFILGSVIVFIVVVYLNHTLAVRALKRKEEQRNLRQNLERRYLMLLVERGEISELNLPIGPYRRNSLLEGFRHFRL